MWRVVSVLGWRLEGGVTGGSSQGSEVGDGVSRREGESVWRLTFSCVASDADFARSNVSYETSSNKQCCVSVQFVDDQVGVAFKRFFIG